MDILKSCAEQEQERSEQKRLAFLRAFSGQDGEIVLEHLADFCGEGRDNFVRDSERFNAYKQGRLSVMIEIRNRLRKGTVEK
ncbi:MAG: hypothetical protein HPZ91_07185 [Lentisphaeria bacterium]|nr:hypothetical protein [Lentisphaeria bacterium]